MPSLVRTPTQHGESRSSDPLLKPSPDQASETPDYRVEPPTPADEKEWRTATDDTSHPGSTGSRPAQVAGQNSNSIYDQINS